MDENTENIEATEGTENTEEVNIAAKALEDIKGHDKIVIEDEETGTEYTLCYSRKMVKDMEKKGITSQYATEMLSNSTLTSLEKFISDFVLPAFKKEQPKITFNEVLGIWKGIEDKPYMIALLVALFNQPMTALIENPTESRMKFRLV